MSAIYDIKIKIEDVIKSQNLDATAVRGKIGLKAGFLLAFVKPDSPDDPTKLTKLRAACKEILNLAV
jgi:hypothetical protein